MKTVVRGLVALALFIVGNTTYGASATFAISDLKLVIVLSNTTPNDPFDSVDNDESNLKHQQIIENAVVFTLADISNVNFQYGTSLRNSWLPGSASPIESATS
jgi:hypothetical protein